MKNNLLIKTRGITEEHPSINRSVTSLRNINMTKKYKRSQLNIKQSFSLQNIFLKKQLKALQPMQLSLSQSQNIDIDRNINIPQFKTHGHNKSIKRRSQISPYIKGKHQDKNSEQQKKNKIIKSINQRLQSRYYKKGNQNNPLNLVGHKFVFSNQISIFQQYLSPDKSRLNQNFVSKRNEKNKKTYVQCLFN